MKKIFFFAAAVLVATSMSAEAVFDWANNVGKLELTGTAAFENVNSQTDKVSTPCITFSNGYAAPTETTPAANFAELTLDGAGFLAGDVVVIDYFYNNSSTKVATVGVYNTAGVELAASADAINGKKADGFSNFMYTLQTDMDTIRIARAKTGKTKTCVAKLEVIRGGVVITKAGTPVFSKAAKKYFDPFKVALTATPSDKIFVSLNNGTYEEYTDSIEINQYDVDYVISAYATYPDAANSDTVTAIYGLKHFIARPVFNARTIIRLDSIKEEEINILSGDNGKLYTRTMDGKNCPSIEYIHLDNQGADSMLLVSFAGRDGLTMRYKNGDPKKPVLTVAADFVQTDSKNFEMWVEGVKSGDTIVFVVTAKGSAPIFDVQYSTASYLNPYQPADDTDPCFTDGLVMTDQDAKIENNYSGWTNLVYTVAEGGHSKVRIKETANGFRIAKILVGAYRGEAPEGIENNAVETKAVKFFRNGQLIIRKNGVEYNALGAQL